MPLLGADSCRQWRRGNRVGPCVAARVAGAGFALVKSSTPCFHCLAQILEEVIKFRWGALPDEQREGIRNYVSNLIIKLSSDEVAFRRERVFLNKLNIILVQARPRAARWAHLRTW